MVKQSYKGNQNLKPMGYKHDYTPEQAMEFMKCATDIYYFIENYVKVVHVDRGIIPFKPYDYQLDVIEKLINNRFNIMKWPRQYGKSTTVAAVILWTVLFTEKYTVSILAHKHDQSRDVLGRLQDMYENLPSWLQQGVAEWNKGSLQLENGSAIMTAATSPGAIRGRTINWVYLDEFAFVQANMQTAFYTSAYPTITSGETTRLTISSTPQGMNLFYKMWVDATEGLNDFVTHEVHWSMMPGRDEAWKLKIIRDTSEEQFRQEFECVDGDTMIEILDTDTGIVSKIRIRDFFDFMA